MHTYCCKFSGDLCDAYGPRPLITEPSLFQGTMTHMAPETMLNGVQSGAADV